MFDFSYRMDIEAVLPAIATASVILLISGKLYNKIRVRFRVKVNCWFCNGRTRVPYDSSNSWYCPDCDQYNGFNADGGYNRPLAEHHSERLNRAWWAERRPGGVCPADNGLCRFCNVNLQLKVRQLAQFVALDPHNYDREVQQYSDRLERVYRLCGRCEAVLAKALREKDKLVAGLRSPPTTPTHSPPPPPSASAAVAAFQAALAMCALFPLLPLLPHPLPFPPLARLVAAAAPYVDWCRLSAVACVCQSTSLLLFARDRNSVVSLLVWIALLAFHRFPLPPALLHDRHHYTTVVQTTAAVVLLLLAVIRATRRRPRTVATVKPVRLHKLSPAPTPAPAPTPTPTTTCRGRPSEPDLGLGLGRLSVTSGRPVTRSQTRGHTFEARHYTCKGGGAHQLFKGLTPATLPPPPPPLTRASSSSLSSGFVSRGEPPTPSPPLSTVDHDALDSVSQCGRDLLPYHRGFPPLSRSPSPAFTVMHVGTPPAHAFGKFYAEMLRYETSAVRSLHKHEPSFLQKVQAFLTPLLFTVLIATNSLVLWTIYRDQYFKTPS